MLEVLERDTSLTPNQRLVLDVLKRSSVPLSAYSILDELRGQVRSPVPIYRALDKLVSIGMAHRLESLAAFVSCSHANGHPVAHEPPAFAICRGCGRVREFSDETVGKRLVDWADREGFHVSGRCIELHGRCADCAEPQG